MSTTIEAAPRRYRIAEVGRLTGFTPTALRFYEQAGVLPPPERTPAGYRVYGDRDVERLRLIARAKDLGCTLEEIAGLVEAWDADRCGPVKHRLRALVEAKVAEVRRHIADQVTQAAQLRATAADLAIRPVDGPCDDGCGCTVPPPVGTVPPDEPACGCGRERRCSGDDTGASPPVRSAAPEPVEQPPPVACSLGSGDMATRSDEWRALLGGVTDRQPLPHGLRLVLGPDAPLAQIARLTLAERECCPFLAFAITIDARGVALEVAAPAEGRVLLESVFGTAA
jgi:MerR family copper efflux transcriptional regulator